MSRDGAGIFSSPERFEEYYAGVAGRLKARREERVRLLQAGLDRLQALQGTAHAVGDAELAKELASHAEAAREQIRALEAVAIAD